MKKHEKKKNNEDKICQEKKPMRMKFVKNNN